MLTLAAKTIVTTKSLPPHVVLLLFPPSPPPPAWRHQTFQTFKALWTIELSFQSMGLGLYQLKLVPYDFQLVVLHTKSIIFFHLWCIPRGSSWTWMNSKNFQYIEALVLAPLGMPEWVWLPPCIHLNGKTFHFGGKNIYILTPSMNQNVTKHGRCCMPNNQLPTKSHIRFTRATLTYPCSTTRKVTSNS